MRESEKDAKPSITAGFHDSDALRPALVLVEEPVAPADLDLKPDTETLDVESEALYRVAIDQARGKMSNLERKVFDAHMLGYTVREMADGLIETGYAGLGISKSKAHRCLKAALDMVQSRIHRLI